MDSNWLILTILSISIAQAALTNNGGWMNRPLHGIKLHPHPSSYGTINGIQLNGVSFNGANLGAMNGGSWNGIALVEGGSWGSWLGFNNSALGDLPLASIQIDDPHLQDLLSLLNYVVECALPEGQAWKPKTSNGTQLEYFGRFGLAPDYLSKPLSLVEQEWMTSCLLVHVNAFGKHILISIRSVQTIGVTEEEIQKFELYEGAFFGNAFAQYGSVFSCQGTPEQQALAESPDRQWRVCTDPSHPNCPTSIGYCSDHCMNYVKDFGYSSCLVNGTTWDQVLNVYLETSVGMQFSPILLVWLAITVFGLFFL